MEQDNRVAQNRRRLTPSAKAGRTLDCMAEALRGGRGTTRPDGNGGEGFYGSRLLRQRPRPTWLRLSRRRRRISGAIPEPPAGVDLNPLKYFDLTEGQTFVIPSAGLGFPSARLGFPSDWLGFPSAQLGIPSVRLGTASLRPSGAASPRIVFGSGRRRPAWRVTFRASLPLQALDLKQLGIRKGKQRRANNFPPARPALPLGHP
jgi:hypothetical protein